jgi:AcrR family transcriptional regulator
MEVLETLNMRDRILAEAAQRFVVHGYNGISMREIAAACKISKAALYYHFADKEDLIVAILDGYLDQFDCLITDCRAGGGPAGEQLGRVVRAIFAQAPEKRSIIRLASQEMPNLRPETRQRFGAAYQRKFIGQFVSLIEAGVAAGEFQPVDAQLAAWILLGMMYPFFYPSQEREGMATGLAIDSLLSIFFNGIRK